MPEGLSASEGTDLGDKITGRASGSNLPHSHILSILEAVLLAIVTITLAWSGYAAAEWSTERSVELARAATLRTEASRANLEAMSLRNFDSSTFDAWFAAYTAGNQSAMSVAERRFRPEFAVAFEAWWAADPETNPDAPPGPTYAPQYQQPKLAEAMELDEQADEAFAAGTEAGETSDRYVRTTLFLASVLFLVGISTHFPLNGARYALLALGLTLLVFSVEQLLLLPRPHL